MSKAFTKEDGNDEPTVVRARSPLPEGVPNYVTARGLALLRAELVALEADRTQLETGAAGTDRAATAALATRIAELQARIGSAVVVDPREHPPDQARFGATVVVRDEGGAERRFEIVGVDEASGKDGRIAFVSPLARAVLGRRTGETAVVTTPRGEETLEVLAITYPD